LTSLFEHAGVQVVPPIDAPPARKRNGWLPLLTVLFLISYGIMTMLIVEQGATIESQRALIRELFKDSTELSAARVKSAQAAAQAPAAKAQSPVTQNSSPAQAPAKQAPSSQAGQQAIPQRRIQSQKTPFQMPSRPASDLSDDRRALIVI
jgi:cytoskeletal protein RodZ